MEYNECLQHATSNCCATVARLNKHNNMSYDLVVMLYLINVFILGYLFYFEGRFLK